MSVTPKLKFAIMCQSDHLRRWQYEAIEQLVATGLAEPVLVIRPTDIAATKPYASGIRGALQRDFPFRLYNHLCVKYRQPALQTVDASNLLDGLERMVVSPIKQGKYRESFATEDLEKIRQHAPDFILRFAFNILQGEILTLPKYGLWSFHHGDEQHYRGTPPGFWEVFEGNPVTGVILQRLTEKLDGGIILQKGYFGTQTSYGGNVNHIHRQASFFAAKTVQEILQGRQLPEQPVPTNAPIYKTPGPLALINYFGKRFIRLTKKLRDRCFYIELWNIGVSQATVEQVIEQGDLGTIDWLERDVPARKYTDYLADPFGYMKENELQVIAEDYSYRTAKGTLSHLSYQSGWKESSAKPYHEEKEHLSYPCMVKINGQEYCIPEIAEAKEIRLYRFNPEKPLEFERAILPGTAAVDATYLHHENLHWIFFSRRGAGIYTHLEAYYAEAIEGEWKPHALNPLICDVRGGRMGGNFIHHKDKLYRPGQDCSVSYGSALNLYEVQELSPTHYKETLINRLEPDASSRYHDGLHTLNRVGDYWLVDGKYQQFCLFALWYQLRLKLAARKRR
jgi:hypothetical protein